MELSNEYEYVTCIVWMIVVFHILSIKRRITGAELVGLETDPNIGIGPITTYRSGYPVGVCILKV